MPNVKDAYETTAGYIAVRDENDSVWVLKKTYLTDSMSHNQRLEKAIDLFLQRKTDAFDRFDEARHGFLH